MKRKIYIGADSAGFALKGEVIEHLKSQGYECVNLGCDSAESCHYPVFASKLCQKLQNGEADLGILVCGTGIGMSLAANKVKGIRAACCSEHFSAKYTRLHNNSNVLCLGGRVIGVGTAIELADLFVDTEFEGGRHENRVNKVMAIEND